MSDNIILLKVTYILDGTGVAIDPAEPVHLDSLVSYVLRPFKAPQTMGRTFSRNDALVDFPLPIPSAEVCGHRVYRASALFPDDGSTESIIFWRKKFRQSRVELTTGSPNITNATYREYNQPLPLTMTRTLTGWMAAWDRREIYKTLKRIRYLGKKSSQGHGKVISCMVEETDEDRCLTWGGVAMRFLPCPSGWKSVRTLPPYWNMINTTPCIVPGDPIGDDMTITT